MVKAEDIVLGSILVGAVAGLVYWVWKDVQKPPRGPTKEEIQQAFDEYLAMRDWYAEDGLNI